MPIYVTYDIHVSALDNLGFFLYKLGFLNCSGEKDSFMTQSNMIHGQNVFDNFPRV